MKEVELTQGYVALVDDDDYEMVNQYKWFYNTHGYAVRNFVKPDGKRTLLPMHRIINKTPQYLQTDHINRNGLDNRKSNLRSCTTAENARNSEYNKKGKTSRYKGVHYVKERKLWLAQIRHKKKKYRLGIFEDEVNAAEAYNDAAIKYHGEFARLNKIPREELK